MLSDVAAWLLSLGNGCWRQEMISDVIANFCSVTDVMDHPQCGFGEVWRQWRLRGGLWSQRSFPLTLWKCQRLSSRGSLHDLHFEKKQKSFAISIRLRAAQMESVISGQKNPYSSVQLCSRWTYTRYPFQVLNKINICKAEIVSPVYDLHYHWAQYLRNGVKIGWKFCFTYLIHMAELISKLSHL